MNSFCCSLAQRCAQRCFVRIIVAASMIHLAITNLAACVALLVPITMTIAHGAGINLIVCAR